MELTIGMLFAVGILIGFARSVSASRQRKRIEAAYKWSKPNVSGDARFSTDEDCRKGKLLIGKGQWLGFTSSGRMLRLPSGIHVTGFGPTGSGKGRDLAVPLLLDRGGGPARTIVVNDPKAQLVAVCHKARLKLGPVYALNPFAIHLGHMKGVKQVCYNPMSSLSADDPKLGIRCDKIADGLVWADADEKSRFWNDGAKEFLSGLMMALTCHGAPEDRNLLTLCRVLCGDVFGYCREIVSKSTNVYVKTRLGSYAVDGAEASRSLADIVQTARVHTKFIRNEVIGPSLSSSDFTFKGLRKSPHSFFLVLPADAPAEVTDRYARLVFACALSEMMSEECLGTTPTTIVLDVCASLGRMQAIEQALAMSRGYGISMVSLFTVIPQMQRVYGEAFRSYIANSGCRVFFPTNDVMTSEEVSKLSGQTEVVSQSRSVSIDQRTGEPHVNDGASQHARPLLLPHEVRELDQDELLIFVQGVKGVIRAKRKPYWKTHPGKYCPDPYEKGKRH